MSVVDTEVTTTPDAVHEDGDHEKFAHVVVPASAVTEAYITGGQGHCAVREDLGSDPRSRPVSSLPHLQGDPRRRKSSERGDE